jgi:hypothetical protein
MDYENFKKAISQTILLTEDRKTHFIKRGARYTAETRFQMIEKLTEKEKEFLSWTHEFQIKRETEYKKALSRELKNMENEDEELRNQADGALEKALMEI